MDSFARPASAGTKGLSSVAALPRRIPTAKPWLSRVFRSDDLRVAEIARRLHVTDVTVRKWLREADGLRRADERQLPLF